MSVLLNIFIKVLEEDMEKSLIMFANGIELRAGLPWELHGLEGWGEVKLRKVSSGQSPAPGTACQRPSLSQPARGQLQGRARLGHQVREPTGPWQGQHIGGTCSAQHPGDHIPNLCQAWGSWYSKG